MVGFIILYTQQYEYGGFLSHRATPSHPFRTMGLSTKNTILGIPHSHGTPPMLLVLDHGVEELAALAELRSDEDAPGFRKKKARSVQKTEIHTCGWVWVCVCDYVVLYIQLIVGV